MTEYLITFNDEWVPDHTAEDLREKSTAVRAVIEEMLADGVLIFTNGGLDPATPVCSVEPVVGKPVFTARCSAPGPTLVHTDTARRTCSSRYAWGRRQ